MTKPAKSARPYLRFLWSHHWWIHRMTVRGVNSVLRRVPFGVKYGVGLWLRRRRYPYCLIEPGDVVVQVGAPLDTLRAGRSRAMYFCLRAGNTGTAIVIEPDPSSAVEFANVCQSRGLSQARVINMAAGWEPGASLTIYVNDRHPATNFTEGSVEYDDAVMSEYHPVTVPADTLDAIFAAHRIENVKLVSITTNKSEGRIVEGLVQTIARGLPYICLACATDEYIAQMKRLGYELISYDDRGYTFAQTPDE